MKKGQKMSQEQREKIRKAHLGKKLSDEHRHNLSLAHMGQIPSNLEQLRQMAIGRKPSPESNMKRRLAQIGKPKNISEEGRARMRIKNYPAWNKGLLGYNAGPKNPRWIADRSLVKVSDRQCGSLYVQWRNACKLRDGHKCKIGNSDCRGKLEVHHILRWKEFPELRYDINNGITLCHFHHPIKRTEEKRLIQYFKDLIMNQCVTIRRSKE